MNSIYKVIFNKTTGTYQAVAEFAKSQTKSSGVVGSIASPASSPAMSKYLTLPAMVMLAMGVMVAVPANANPSGEKVATALKIDSKKRGQITSGLTAAGITGTVNLCYFVDSPYSSVFCSNNIQDLHSDLRDSVYIGKNVQAADGDRKGNYAVVIGENAYGIDKYVISLGKYTKATANSATAVGAKAAALASHSVALGGDESTGAKVETDADYSLAVMAGAKVNKNKKNGIAIGQGATIGVDDSDADNSNRATAIGTNAFANGNRALALGASLLNDDLTSDDAQEDTDLSEIEEADERSRAISARYSRTRATADDTIAIGTAARATADKATALGYRAAAEGANAQAFGSQAVASGISSLAQGTSAKATSINAQAFGNQAQASGVNATAIGTDSQASGHFSQALGATAEATKFGAQAFGLLASAKEHNAIAIGTGTKALGKNSQALGNSAVAEGAGSQALGTKAKSRGKRSLAAGFGANAANQLSLALGANAQATQDNSVALGAGSVADRVAINAGLVDTSSDTANPTANQVYTPLPTQSQQGEMQKFHQGIKDTVKGSNGAVSVGSSTATRQIINVAAGSTDTDAVNVAQLKALANLPMNFEADNNGAVPVKLGERLPITGAVDGGITTNADLAKNGLTIGIKTRPDGGLDLNAQGVGIKLDQNNGGQPAGSPLSLSNNGLKFNFKDTDFQLVDDGGVKKLALKAGADETKYFADADNDTVTPATSKDAAKAFTNDKNVLGIKGGLTGEEAKAGAKNIITKIDTDNNTIEVALNPDVKGLHSLQFADGQGIKIGDGNTQVNHNENVVIGKGAVAKSSSQVGLGLRKAPGFDEKLTGSPTGKNHIGTYYQMMQGVAVGDHAYSGDSSTAVGARSKAEGTYSVTVGANAFTKNEGGVALGAASFVTGASGVAIGREAVSTGAFAQALGSVSSATGEKSFAVGHSATASGKRGIAIGASSNGSDGMNKLYQKDANQGAHATADDTIALGSNSKATQDKAIAIGRAAQATVADGVALGSESMADRAAIDANAVQTIDRQIVNTATNQVYTPLPNDAQTNPATQPFNQAIRHTVKGNKSAVSVGNGTNTRQITNVAAGSTDTDAVNVAQLRALANLPMTFEADEGGQVERKLGERLPVKGKENGGITTSTNLKTNGIDIAVKAGNGIAVDATGVKVKPKNDGALTVNADGVAVNVNNKKGIEIGTDNKLAVKADTTKGIKVDGDGIGINLKAGDNLLSFDDNALVVNPQNVVEQAQLPVVYTDKQGNKLTKVGDEFYQVINGGRARVATPKDQVIASMNNGTNNTKQAPMTLANVQSSINLKQPLGNGPQVTADKPADFDTIKNNAATVEDVMKVGFNLQNNSQAKDFVQAFDTLNVVDGNGTMAIVETDGQGKVSTIKVDVKPKPQGGIEVDAGGVGIKLKADDHANKNPLTVSDQGLNLNIDSDTLTVDGAGTDKKLKVKVKPQGGITTEGGQGLAVQTGDGVEVAEGKVKAKAHHGITVDGNGISVKAKQNDGALTVDENGVAVNVDNQGIQVKDNKLAVKPNTNKGIEVTDAGVGVKLAEQNNPLKVDGNGLTLNIDDETLELADNGGVGKKLQVKSNKYFADEDVQNDDEAAISKEKAKELAKDKRILGIKGGLTNGQKNITTKIDATNNTIEVALKPDVKDLHSLQFADGQGIKIGDAATQADDPSAIAMGRGAQATVADGVALGSESMADRQGFAQPVNATDNATANNNQVYTPISDAVIRDAQGLADQLNQHKEGIVATVKGNRGAVSVGSSTATRQIINLAAGSEDTDAVNVAQLKSLAAMPMIFQADENGQVERKLGERLPIKGKENGGITTSTNLQTNGIDIAVKADDKKGVEVGVDGVSVKLNTDKGVKFGTDGKVEVNLANNKGLEFDGAGDKGIAVKAGDGIEVDATGVKVKPKNDGALTVNADGVAVNVDNSKGVEISGNQLAVKVNNQKGVQFGTDGRIEVKPNAQNGIKVDGDGIGINLKAGDNLLSFDNNALTVNPQNVVEQAQLPVVYTDKQGNKLTKVGDEFYQVINGGRARVATPKDQVIASMNNGNGETKQDPMTLANVQSSINLKQPLGNGPQVTADKPADFDTIKNNAATVEDVMKIGFNLKNNNQAKDFVQAFDTLNVVDGNGTMAIVTTDNEGSTIKVDVKAKQKGGLSIDDRGVSVDVDNKTIQLSPEGKVAAKTTNLTVNQAGDEQGKVKLADGQNDGNALVTANTVMNAINDSGFTLTTDKTGTGTVTGKQDQLIKAGEKVTIEAGDNIAITQDKGKVSIRTKREVDFGKVTVGDDTDEFYGVRTPIRITSNGMGGHEQNHITGLTHTLQPAGDSHQQLTLNNDLDISSKDADSLKLSRAATVADALSTGFNLQENGNSRDFVRAYDTVNFVDSDSVQTKVVTDKDGKISRISNEIKVNPNQGLERTQAGVGIKLKPSAGNPLNVNEYGLGLDYDVDKLAVKDQILTVNTTDLFVSDDPDNADGNTGRVQLDDPAKGKALVTAQGVADAINESGFLLKAEDETVKMVSPGDSVNIKAEKTDQGNGNIRVFEDNGDIVIGTADDVNFNTVKVEEELKVGDVKIDQDGINAGNKQITNVKEGEKDTDAVNVKQLKDSATKYFADTDFDESQTAATSKDKAKAAKDNVIGIKGGVTGDEKQDGASNITTKLISDKNTLEVTLNPVLKGLKSIQFAKDQGITMGDTRTLASDPTATAIGRGANATAFGSQAFGRDAMANADYANALGNRAIATAQGAQAMGAFSSADADFAQALGMAATASQEAAVALGAAAEAKSVGGVALGVLSVADRAAIVGATTNQSANPLANQVYSAVTGDQNQALNNAIAATVKGNLGAVSVGDQNNTRQITNVAAGSSDTDAANIAQLKAVAELPMSFEADKGQNDQDNDKVVTRKLGESLKVNGKANSGITTSVNAGKDGIDIAVNLNTDKGVKFGTDGKVEVNLANNKGLEFDGAGDKGIAVKAGDGIEVDATGVKVKPKNDGALTVNENGVAVNVNNEKGIEIGTDNKLAVKANTNKGIKVDGDGIGINLKAGDNPLRFDDQGALTFNTQKAVEQAQLPVVYTDKAGNKLTKVGDKFYQVNPLNGNPTRQEVAPNEVIASLNNGLGQTQNAPMTLANVAHNITPKKDLGSEVISYANKPTGLQENNAATVGDVLNAGFNLKERGNNKDFVQAFDTLDIINGAGTTAQVTTDDKHQVNQITFNVKADHQKGIKVTDEGVGINIDDNAGLEFKPMTDKSASKLAVKADGTTIKVEGGEVKANTAGLTVNPSTKPDAGRVIINDGDSGNALVTANTVMNAINESGFTLATSQSGTGQAVGESQLIKTGEKVIIDAGDNMSVIQAGGRVSIATKDDVVFKHVLADDIMAKNSLTVGDTTDGRKAVKITSTGKAGSEKNIITGLSDTLPRLGDAAIQQAISADLDISSDQADNAKLSRAATVADALSTGFNLQENGVAKDFVKAYDTIDFVDGQGTRVMVDSPAGDKKNTIRVDLNLDPAKGLEINQEKGGLLGIKLRDEDSNPLYVDENGLTVLTTNLATTADGKLVEPDTDDENSLVNAKSIVDAINHSGFVAKANGDAGEVIHPGDTLELTNGRNIEISRDGGKFTINTAKDAIFNSLSVGGEYGNVMIDEHGVRMGDVHIGPTGINAGDTRITHVADGVDPSDAVNVSQLLNGMAQSAEHVTSEDGSIFVQQSVNPSTKATTFDLSVNTDDVTITKGDEGKIKAKTTTLTPNENGKIDTPNGSNENALVTAGDIANAINNSGFTLQANGKEGKLVKAGDTISINQGDNINVTQDESGNLTVATKQDVAFETVKVGDTLQ
ncbi:hypothetical protein M2R47_04970, partial [Moraxella sp. Tifton1]|uniref:ESPR-type extended signal peptide-containing protein n=1 Tax=Moraxella oculi TaxID=2940516 RepID=UPI002010E34F